MRKATPKKVPRRTKKIPLRTKRLLRLPPELDDDVVALAALLGESITDTLIMLLREALAARQPHEEPRPTRHRPLPAQD